MSSMNKVHIQFSLKRREFYWAERIYTNLVVKLLPFLDRTFLTPNMVTVSNIINAVIACFLIWGEHHKTAALLVQVYLFLDILDGNLARYKNLCTPWGKILDQISDRFFYNIFFVVLAIKLGMDWYWLLFYLLVHNVYGIVATFIIVPQIRRLKEFKRWGIKKYLMERGIILGMDLSTQSVITTVLLFTPFKEWIIYSITLLYALDLLYRLIELGINLRSVQKLSAQ